MEYCDIIIVSGGSSQGEKDYTAQVISRVSQPGLLTHGIAIKPGKPVILGFDESSKTILAGLPGHPVSAMVVFRILFEWFWKTLTGQKESFPIPAKMSCNIASSPGKTTIQPVTLASTTLSTGASTSLCTGSTMCDDYIAEPVFGKSGMISSLTKADGYIIIDMNKEGLNKDESVLVYLF
jgi:molybdopterin molybdotransferase